VCILPSLISQQLMNDPVLTGRLGSSWHGIVILERLARGGGAARWFFVQRSAELELVFDVLRGGSCVTFYFADQLHVETDTDDARQRLFDEITSEEELVLGYPSAGNIEVDMEIISGPGELAELLMHRSEGDLIVWGKWPARSNDGHDGITLNLVDADGILRTHPH
jgi:hypothetical protein